MIKTTRPGEPDQKIGELKRKIRQADYIRLAIQEIATLLTDSIKKRNFYVHERKRPE